MDDKSFYVSCKTTDSIQQGDIFLHLPFFRIGSNEVVEVIKEKGGIVYKKANINDYSGLKNTEKKYIVPAIVAPGIIISQNCDASRDPFISYCAIKKLEDIDRETPPNSPIGKIERLTEEKKEKFKYFYLPPLPVSTFKEKMAVEFSCIHQISREALEKMTIKRKFKLSNKPLEHFRDKLSHYFQRFSYDPWYILNKDEFKEFVDKKIKTPQEKLKTKAYPWQE